MRKEEKKDGKGGQNKRKQGSERTNEYSMNAIEYNCSLSQNGARYESGMREEFAFAFLSTVHVC